MVRFERDVHQSWAFSLEPSIIHMRAMSPLWIGWNGGISRCSRTPLTKHRLRDTHNLVHDKDKWVIPFLVVIEQPIVSLRWTSRACEVSEYL